MEPIKKPLTSKLPLLTMYRPSLDQLVAMFEKTCKTVTIADRNNRYDSLDDMRLHVGTSLSELDIRGEDPGVSCILNHSETIKDATWVFMRNEIRMEEVPEAAEILYFKAREFLLIHSMPRFRRSYLLVAFLALATAIADAVWQWDIFRHQQIPLLFITFLICGVIALVASQPSTCVLRLETKANLPSFWTKNRDALILGAIASVMAAILGWFFGRLK
jgi:hypothetical protein